MNQTKIAYYPHGWFSVAFSHELHKSQILSVKICGEELVLFRTTSGKLCASTAYCPHMGAHLGKGGLIEDEHIRCPFHGICFDCNGTNVKTGYATPPNEKLKLRVFPIQEIAGIIFIYYHPNKTKPDWKLPVFTDADQSIQMSQFHSWHLNAHPQDIAENSADTGHFTYVHGYKNLEIIEPLSVKGPYLHAKYRLDRTTNVLFGIKKTSSLEMEIHQYGLGCAVVHAFIRELGIESYVYVCPTLTDINDCILRVSVYVKTSENSAIFRHLFPLIPKSFVKYLIRRQSFSEFKKDVQQDVAIWNNKKHINPPLLIKGDGPVAQYRKWASQFQI
ncbi:MAG: Rieske 2Fe-2S domain-containing protein [Gammaproteobacteria bacterium]